MQRKSHSKVTIEKIINMLDRLSPQDEPDLVDELQSWFLKRGLEQGAESCVILYKYSMDRIENTNEVNLCDLSSRKDNQQSREQVE